MATVYVREIEIRYKARRRVLDSMDCPRTVALFMRPILCNLPVEEFYALYLNNKNECLGYRMVARGTVSECAIHPREIFVAAVQLMASSVILVHNHPSGAMTPSPEDRIATDRVRKAGTILGIELLDHVIIGTGYLSFREEGYFSAPAEND